MPLPGNDWPRPSEPAENPALQENVPDSGTEGRGESREVWKDLISIPFFSFSFGSSNLAYFLDIIDRFIEHFENIQDGCLESRYFLI